MEFHFYGNESHFHKNGLVLRLALKQRTQEHSEIAYCLKS